MKRRIIYVGTLIDLAAIFEPDEEAERIEVTNVIQYFSYEKWENSERKERSRLQDQEMLRQLPAQVYWVRRYKGMHTDDAAGSAELQVQEVEDGRQPEKRRQ